MGRSDTEKLFEEAEAKGLMDDRTLFIITADHNPHSGGEYTKIVTNENDRKSIAPIRCFSYLKIYSR